MFNDSRNIILLGSQTGQDLCLKEIGERNPLYVWIMMILISILINITNNKTENLILQTCESYLKYFYYLQPFIYT